jgi:hypothetical protein
LTRSSNVTSFQGGYDYLLKFVARGVAHYQSIIEGMLESDYGIEKYFSYVVIKSPFIKHHFPIQNLFGETHSREFERHRRSDRPLVTLPA